VGKEYERLLENSATSINEDFITSLIPGARWALGYRRILEVLPPWAEGWNGVVHGNGLHLMKEPLGTNGLKEAAEGTAGK
jgi:hypothetical protein